MKKQKKKVKRENIMTKTLLKKNDSVKTNKKVKKNKIDTEKHDKEHLEFVKRIRNILSTDPTVKYVDESDYQINQRRGNTST